MQVSRASPFSDCPPAELDDKAPRGEVEPVVAVNPRRPRNVVAVWTQDRFRGLVAGVSFDGGSTWQRRVVPGFTRCTGGTFDYVDDAWLSFGPRGVLHLSAKVMNGEQTASGRLATRSLNGGRRWSEPEPLVMETRQRSVNYSGGAITADPHRPRFVYSVVPKFAEPDPDGGNGAFRGALFFNRSRDGGRSWQPARKVFDAGSGRLVTGHQIVVGKDGTLINAFTLIDFRDTPRRPAKHVAVMRSTNQGRSWSKPTLVAKLRSTGTTDPQAGDPVATGSRLLTDAAVDPRSGRIHLVWQDARFHDGQADAIALSSSPDGGRTWTAPVKVNATPSDLPTNKQQAFTPSVEVAAGGTVAVTYSDFRHNDEGTDLPTDRFAVRCHPYAEAGCDTASGFGNEVRLTEASFDMRQAPNLHSFGPGGFFLGDYMGLTSTGRGFLAVFSQPHDQPQAGDPASVFARRIHGWPTARLPPIVRKEATYPPFPRHEGRMAPGPTRARPFKGFSPEPMSRDR